MIQFANWNYRIFLSFKLRVDGLSPAVHSIALIVKGEGKQERTESY